MARAAEAVKDIKFSVNVRGIHWLTSNDVIAHELGESCACKVYLWISCCIHTCNDVISHALGEIHELTCSLQPPAPG